MLNLSTLYTTLERRNCKFKCRKCCLRQGLVFTLCSVRREWIYLYVFSPFVNFRVFPHSGLLFLLLKFCAQVSFAVLTTDSSLAKQISTRLSDTPGFISYLGTQNFPGVAVTSPPAVFDNGVPSSAPIISRPSLFLKAILATVVAVASMLG